MNTYDIHTNLTLSKEFVLRKNKTGNYLFHSPSLVRDEVAKLYFFKYNLESKSFDILIANSEKFKHNNISFASTVTIHPLNVYESGSKKIIFNFPRPVGRAIKNDNLHLSQESLMKAKLNEIKEEYVCGILIDDEADPANREDRYSYTQETNIKCASGTALMSLDENLNIFPCNYGIGNKLFLADSAKKKSESASQDEINRL